MVGQSSTQRFRKKNNLLVWMKPKKINVLVDRIRSIVNNIIVIRVPFKFRWLKNIIVIRVPFKFRRLYFPIVIAEFLVIAIIVDILKDPGSITLLVIVF